MCTLSVLFEPEWGYRLAMNRDESLQRSPASSVVAHGRTQNLRVVYPQDADAHGTWIGANTRGVSLALLNRHPEGYSSEGRKLHTRGGIIVETLDAVSAGDAAERVVRVDPKAYLPFTFVALDPQGNPEMVVSNGVSLERRSLTRKAFSLASSSFQSNDVVARREAGFVDWLNRGGRDLTALHRSHEPTRGPFSVCMHREDASSVSLTLVEFTRAARSLSYSLGSPCEAYEAQRFALA